jgi:hypothetical protein
VTTTRGKLILEKFPGLKFQKTKGGNMDIIIVSAVLFIFLGGVLVGYSYCMSHTKPSGTFVIDVSDPMKDICRLELAESLDSMFYKKTIVLNIETHGDISQE